MKHLLRSPSWWAGVLLGCAVTAVACELPYVNWHRVAAPVDQRPLMIRKDAKGDGRFAAPRSGGRRHRGVDLMAPLESPVRAVRSGIVVQVSSHRGLGRYVELEHRGEVHTLYAHLSTVQVEPGDRVRQGQVVGRVGKTGNARHAWITPHLHFEVVKRGVPVNPQLLGLRIADAGVVAGSSRAEEPDESSDASGGE